MREQLQVQTFPDANQAALASVSSDKFIKEQSADQWVFTKFKGTDVLGPDNARVGAVDDLLFDKNGKIILMVVGVGGFLGIGVKNVAIGMSAFDVIPTDIGSDRNNAQTNDPTSVKLKVLWTKDQLMEAPEFQLLQTGDALSHDPAAQHHRRSTPAIGPAAPR